MTVCDHDVIERAHNRKELREKIADIIVRKVLQEDYDDMVEGYLDEILMAADEIILLPAYQAVAQTYYENIARAAAKATGEAS
jgi:transcriptional regulator CtsR